MVRDKELMENVNERSNIIFQHSAKILTVDTKNAEGISTQTLDPMDIKESKVINIVPESLKVFLDKLCKGCGTNNKKLFLLHKIW